MIRVAAVLFGLLSWGAIGRAQTPAPAATPALVRTSTAIRPGTYDLEVAFGGGVLDGTLVITSAGDTLRARLAVGGHDSPVHPVRTQGAELILESGPGLQVRYQLQFKGDSLSGSFTYDGEAGTVAGRRRRPAGS